VEGVELRDCIHDARDLSIPAVKVRTNLQTFLDMWTFCGALPIRIYGVDRDNFTFLCDKMILEEGF